MHAVIGMYAVIDIARRRAGAATAKMFGKLRASLRLVFSPITPEIYCYSYLAGARNHARHSEARNLARETGSALLFHSI